MRHFYKYGVPAKFFVLLFFVAFAFISSVKAQGEDPIYPWNVELRLGAAVPTGEFADMVDTGGDIGARIGYSLRERFMIRGNVEIEVFPSELGFENTQIWHYSGGVEYLFTDRGITDWRLSAHAGIGASMVTYENVTEFSETYLSVNYGVKLGRGITDNTDWFVSLMGRTVFANPQDVTPTGAFTTIPISIGLNHRFNLNDEPITEKMKEPPLK